MKLALDQLDTRGRRILQNFGIVLATAGLSLIIWEAFHDDDWHLWVGVVLILVGVVCIWPPIVTALASLGRTLAPFVPGYAKRQLRQSQEVKVVKDDTGDA